MKQGEIWGVNLGPTVGAEITKTRPCIIISEDNMGVLPLKVIVPITDWKDHFCNYSWMVRINPSPNNGLSKTSSIDCFQIRSISVDRILVRLGRVPEIIINQTKEAISKVVGI